MDTPATPTPPDDATTPAPPPGGVDPAPEATAAAPESAPSLTPPTDPPVPPVPPAHPDAFAAPLPSPELPAPTAAPAAATSGSSRTVIIVVAIVVGVVLILGGLGVAIVLLAQNAVSAISENGIPGLTQPDDSDPSALYPEKEPLIEGDPGPTVAADPTVCPQECFTVDHFDRTVLGEADYAALGTPDVPAEWDDFRNSTAQKEFLYSASGWESGDGNPDECFPVTVYSPIAAPLDGRADSADDPVGFTQSRLSSDQYSSLYESPRLFTDSASAEAHLATMLSLIQGCSTYEIGDGQGYWTADVTPMPALDLPASVAATGWVEDSPFGRFYGADLQRGNLVVRITLYTDGTITEEAWRDYLVASAENLASLTP